MRWVTAIVLLILNRVSDPVGLEEKEIEKMGLLQIVVLTAAAAWLVKDIATLTVDAMATLIAAFYYWRRAQVCMMMNNAVPTARRRLLAKHLQLSIGMTAHFSLFPRSALRGYALVHALAKSR